MKLELLTITARAWEQEEGEWHRGKGSEKGIGNWGWGPHKAAAMWRERSLGLGCSPGCFPGLCERGFGCWDEK